MRRLTLCSGFVLLLLSGCALKEIVNKTKFGPEFREASDETNSIRWTSIEQGFDFKWDKDFTTGITYRRRDVDDGGGGNDNGVWFSVSFPIWKAPKKPDPTAQEVAVLTRRLAELETAYREQGLETVAEAQ